ncbi:thioredoxin [bacterium D16-51]|nr:thioredoxin [bacterium D16-59]RKI59652.1 thioredoxin [bacterium D16-51]
MAVLHVTKENFEAEVLQSEKPVLVDFWAGWCGPCKMVAPVLEEIAAEVTDVKITKVNVDEQPELAQKFQVMSIPTMVLIKEGKVVDTTVGAQPKEDLVRFIHS